MDKRPDMSEAERRDAAQANIAEVEDGREVPGRVLKQMVSVRLEAQLLKELRELASQRGVSVSDLLREAAITLVENSHPAPARVTVWSASRPQSIVTFGAGGQFTHGLAATSEQDILTGTNGAEPRVQLAG